MPNVEVRCSVANCIFHNEGNFCGAEKIEVDMDHHSQNHQTEFASDFDFDHLKEEASSSRDTCCKTFETKENHE